MNENVLKVKIESRRDFVEAALEAGRKIDQGEAEEIEEPYVVSFRSREELYSVFREKNIELLETIAREEPNSIRELARLVDRDVKAVHDALSQMEHLGIIEFEEEGRAKKPRVWYDEIDIEIDIPLTSHDSGGPAEATA